MQSFPGQPMNLGQYAQFEPFRVRPWREMAMFSVMVMEVCWVVPWFRTLTISTEQVTPARAFLVLLGMMLFAHLIVRLLHFLRIKPIYRHEVLLILLLASLFLGFRLLLYQQEKLSWLETLNRPLKNLVDYNIIIPDEMVVFLVVVTAWWRGITIAQDYMGPSTVRNQFATGMVMFVFYVLFVMLGTNMPAPMQSFYLFLFVTLIGMTAARISIISSLRGGRSVSFDLRWFLGILGVAVIMVALAYGIVYYGGGAADALGTVMMVLVAIIALLLWLALAPLFFLVVLLLERIPIFRELIDTLINSAIRIIELGKAIGQYLYQLIEKTGLISYLAGLGPILRLICLGGVIFLFLGGVLIWAAIQLWRERARLSLDEEHTNPDTGELLKLLNAAIRRRWAQMQNQLIDLLNTRYRHRLLAAARVRQIYAELMELSLKLQVPRPAAQTPLEFMPSLEALFTESVREVGTITQAYVRVRYGMLPETWQELQEIEAAWVHVKSQGLEYLRLREKHKTKQPGAK